MQKSYTVDEARMKLEHFCVYQERCHEEVVQKLRSLNMIPQAIDVIVVHLIDNNFLNEERFACSFARGRFRIKQWGRRRIENELKARHITKPNITRALREIDPDEYLEVFHALAERQWAAATDTNIMRKKKRVMDYLLRKGYESNMVQEKIFSLE